MTEENKLRLLFVGGKPIRKGFPLLIRSLAKVPKDIDIELVAVGFQPSSTLRSFVEKAGVGKMVSFQGYVKTEQLRELYRRSDLYVLPSLYDTFSIATLEAMATGLPVLVSWNTGIRDILRNWDNAVLIDPLDTAKFAEVLTALACDGKLRKRVGAQGRMTAQHFSWGNVAARMLRKFGERLS